MAGRGKPTGGRAALWRRAAVWSGWEGMLAQRPSRSRLVRYTEYTLSGRELAFAAAAGSVVIYAAFYLIYQSAAISLAAAVLGLLTPRWRRQALLERRRSRLKLQFKEALYSLTSSLAAGRSLENSFRGVLEDMKLLYSDSGADMLKEFQIICHRLDNFDPLELALRDLDERSRIDEMTQFVDALTTCKRSGGDLLEVMKRTSTIIGDKLTVEGEIKILLAQKRLESRIMMAVPFVFLGFLGFAAPDYMAPLYSGLGYALLTFLFVLLLGCFWLMDRIMRIDI
ncbi:type II secretion system F family protein [Paenibacillus soyae]|uniref:Type II secretion system F family protein n=1 Tax=Paenibacillus soyae TaxID=2969249 RepID=A0A9X2MKL5_9BACL|nr:type II secretion system F family protein [Paenibacillus soyae]MCR2802344.1 type II secretion system F family protein [Paenibacillus soyae]